MGRKDQFTRNINPAKARIEWAGADDAGHFHFYEKEQGDTVLNNIKFCVLAERHAIGGYSEEHGTGLYSNEVDDIAKEELVLRKYVDGKAVELCRGIYKDIAGERTHHQANYQKVVYAVILGGDAIKAGTIVRIILSGAAVSAWFDVSPEAKQGAILVNSFTDHKKGRVNYRSPVFQSVELTGHDDDIAEMAYVSVEAYIKGSPTAQASQQQEAVPGIPQDNEPPMDTTPYMPMEDEDDIPF